MVLLVGFGVQGGQVRYWTAQNSWSKGWGDDGFFRMQRGVNLCGIETGASSVVVTVEEAIPPVPNSTTQTTSTSTVLDPNSTSTTTTTFNPNTTLAAEESSDDGLIKVVADLLLHLVAS
eukprot:1508004-Amphidinium_carterae.1